MVRVERDDPIVESLDKTGLPPWDDGKYPICPVCFSECDTFYYGKDGDVVGCDECVKAYDAWEMMYDAMGV